MATTHPTPQEIEVRQMLGMLYGNDLEINPVDPLATGADSGHAAAVFIDDNGTPVSACVCDMKFAAFAGAALTKIPLGGAEDAAESGKLTENMLGNLYEVMNICSRLFMDSSSPHLKLDKLYASISDLPDNALALVNAITGRLDLKVNIPGYGEGHLSFLST